MKRLICESYLHLLWIEFVLAFRDLHALHSLVRDRKVASPRRGLIVTTDVLCKAMELSCVFYPKRVLCLQRSSATVLMLRRYGIHAHLVIGAQILPFRSHAWVEVNEMVVNDKPHMQEIYSILERC